MSQIDYRIDARWRTRKVEGAYDRTVVYVELRVCERTVRNGNGKEHISRATIFKSHLLPWQADRLVKVLRDGCRASDVSLSEEGSYFTRPAPQAA